MNEQIRSAVVGTIVALIGWMSVTTVNLMVAVAEIKADLAALLHQVTDLETIENKRDDRAYSDRKSIREMIQEETHGNTR